MRNVPKGMMLAPCAVEVIPRHEGALVEDILDPLHTYMQGRNYPSGLNDDFPRTDIGAP